MDTYIQQKATSNSFTSNCIGYFLPSQYLWVDFTLNSYLLLNKSDTKKRISIMPSIFKLFRLVVENYY